MGLSFQALGAAPPGSPSDVGVNTWFAALEPGASSFIGPTSISTTYFADRPPVAGQVCAHSLCTVGGPLAAGCDPAGFTTTVCNLPGFAYCCTSNWDRACAYNIGNAACPAFTCGGRTLGDYASQTSLVTGALSGQGATFMPVWTQGAITPSGLRNVISASLVQVTP